MGLNNYLVQYTIVRYSFVVVFFPPDIQDPQVVAWLDWLFMEMLLSILEINSRSLPIPVPGCKSQQKQRLLKVTPPCSSLKILPKRMLLSARVGFGDDASHRWLQLLYLQPEHSLLLEGMKHCPPKSRDEHSWEIKVFYHTGKMGIP